MSVDPHGWTTDDVAWMPYRTDGFAVFGGHTSVGPFRCEAPDPKATTTSC